MNNLIFTIFFAIVGDIKGIRMTIALDTESQNH
jgi:hypothetical protein